MAVTQIATTSREFVHADVTATIAGAPITPGAPPKIALMSSDGNPTETDWFEAEWSGGTARLMIGPDGGAVVLAPGRYHLWVTFTAGLEQPVYRSGTIHIY